MKIAFDLDGVIIGRPPLVPKKILERLFAAGGKDSLHCHFPSSKLNQKIRQLSHFYLLRPPISENIDFLKKAARKPEVDLYVISSRYSFLAGQTKVWLQKRKIDGLFKEIHLNLKNEPPHLFKERKIRELGIDIFVDDDPVLCRYFKQNLPQTKVFCVNYKNSIQDFLPTNENSFWADLL